MLSEKSRALTIFAAVTLILGVLTAPQPADAAEADADWSFRTETPRDIWSEGGSWAVGTSILVLVNDGTSGPEFAETVQVEQNGPNPANVRWTVNTGDFVIEAGDRVTVDDGTFIKNLDVLSLTIDDVDMASDTISGSAPAGTTFPVHASDGVMGANLDVTSDSGGAWTADFAGVFDIRPGTGGSAAIFDAENDATERNWNIPLPEIEAVPVDDSVRAHWWPIGLTVSVEIDDPSTGVGVDWSDSAITVADPGNPERGYFDFAPLLAGFDVAEGQTITMTDGATTKVLLVPPLTIAEVDVDADIVYGTASADALVNVWVGGTETSNRVVTAASDGTWIADFAVAGDGWDPFDILPGHGINAWESDEDHDSTQAHTGVPNPQFSVETPNQIWSHGDGWIAGRTATIKVNDGVTDVYSTTAPVTAWGTLPWEVGWNATLSGFDILPGHVVTVDDGVDIVRTLDVVDIAVTSVDEINDTISGIAPPDAWLDANAGDGATGANRHVQADSSGNFTIDFGNVGIEDWEQDILDLRPGVGGSVQVFENDGDSTHHSWRIADPYFGVDVTHDEMWAIDWPIGATLDFDVFVSEGGVLLYSGSMTVVETSWGQTEAGFRFWDEVNIVGGQTIEITDGTTTRELVVSTLVVTNVDPDANTYTGTVTDLDDRTREVCAWARDLADPQHRVELCVLPDSGTGAWTIDFGGVGDVVPGDHTGAYQRDEDGDETSYAWHVPPWIYVQLGGEGYGDEIHLDQWAFPVDVTNGVDTFTVFDTDGDGWEAVEFDVSPGQTITATGDDGKAKSLYLEDLSVDTVTLWNEVPPSTVYGSTTAAYDGGVQVTASADYGWWTERSVHASAGAYEADFANPGNGWREQELGYFGQGGSHDIHSGGEIRAHIYDADNDQIQAIWHSTNPRIIIVRGNDRIEAIDFPLGEPLTIELDDPAFAGIEFSETGIVEANPDKPWETLLIFELGDYTVPDEATVTALDETGTPLVETEVIAFTIDLVDPDAETITGTAPAGEEVLVQADGNWRYPIADASNTWVADFSVPGDQPGEENPVDIGPGSSGGATLLADGGSATTVLWYLSNAGFSVDPDQEHIWGWEFAPNTSVAIAASTVGQGSFPTDEWGNFDAYFDPATLDITAGSAVVVSDGETEKSHTVTSLAITGIDETLDQVSGFANDGATVGVWTNDPHVHLDVAVTGGTWLADFGGLFGIGPGSNGGAQQMDDDGDSTHVSWQVADPVLHAYIGEHGYPGRHPGDILAGETWEPNSTADIHIDGVYLSTVTTDTWGNFGIDWETGLDVDITRDTTVVVTQGSLTKTLEVTSLAVTGIDVGTDIVTGTADGPFDIWLYDTDAWRHVDHDGVGEWSVDWRVPGPSPGEENTRDLVPGDTGDASECDSDRDCTHAIWNVSRPIFRVDPQGGGIWGHEWYEVVEVTISIDGTVLETVPVDENGDWATGTDPAELSEDTVVEVSGGGITKTLMLTALTISSVDETADAVLGTAEPGTDVEVEIHDIDHGVWRTTTSDASTGEWTADFTDPPTGDEGEGSVAFEPGVHGAAFQEDDDGDTTWINWNVPNPSFSVEAPFNAWSNGDGWVEDRTVTLTVDSDDDPSNGVLFADTTIVERWGSEPWEVGWNFELEGLFEIMPGQFVSVSDGVEISKDLWAEEIEITEIDEEADTVSGTATPFAIVDAFAWNEDPEYTEGDRTVEADADGFWTADFANPGTGGHETGIIDIQIGTAGEALISDEDGDSSHRGWYLEEPPEPNFFVRPDGDEMWGAEWYGGPEVTVLIHDAFGALAFEVSFLTEDGEFYEEIDFDIIPGDYIVVTDGEFTKDHWVTELMVTQVDAAADMVHGTAEPGAEVFVGSSFPGTIWEHLNFQFGPDNRNADSLNEHLQFRQAVGHAIDRDLLVAEIPGAAFAIDSYVDAFIPELSQHAWAQYSYDPATAAALIDGLCVDLGRDCVSDPPVAVLTTSSDREDRLAMADLLVPMFAAAGIELQLDLEDPDVFFGQTLWDGTFDIGEWGFVGARSLSWLTGTHYSFDPEERFEQNLNNWGTPDSSVIDTNTARMAELIGLMEATDDWAEIETYIAEAEHILADQAVIIPLYVREGEFEVDGPYRVVTADVDGNWTADFSVSWEDQDALDIAPGVGGYAEETDDDGDATHAGWSGEATPVNDPPVGTVAPTTQSVFYGDVIAPFVISVADADSPLVDASAELPPDLELLGAPCSGDESVDCVLTIEGTAKLAAGEHTFSVVLDDGDDTSTVAMTISVVAELDELRDIESELASLIADGAFSRWAGLRARIALGSIQWAAKPWYWDDNGQPESKWVFSTLRMAVGQLTKIDDSDTTQPEAVSDLVDRIVRLTRRCALYSIDVATSLGGNQRWIDRGVAEFDKGDDKWAAGDGSRAVRHYSNAWRFAGRAMR